MPEFHERKPARQANDHVVILEERGLTICDEERAGIKKKLENIGYYRLSGYYGPLQSSRDSFREGTCFDDIFRLYEFDHQLRRLTSHATKSIEICLKAKMTDVLSLVHESAWYSNKSLFYSEKTKKEKLNDYFIYNDSIRCRSVLKDVGIYDSVIRKIKEAIQRNSEALYIKKFRNEYGPEAVVPSWMMTECISFGTLSKLFSILRHNSTTKSICMHFGCPSPEVFISWVHGFVVLRNICAHHARLWNIRPTKDLLFPKREKYRFLTQDGSEDLRQFYGIGSCLVYCLKSVDPELHTSYVNQFWQLVKDYKIDVSAMGFPKKLEPYDIWREEEEPL